MKASTIFINILSLASLYLAVSCNEEEQHGQTVRTIMATIEQSSTRTALDGPDADGVYKTIWSSEDAIAVFSGNNAATEFKLTSGANTNTAEFEGNAASDNMVAVYPYSIVKGRTGSTISVTLPEVQEYVSGNIPQGAYPMAAVSDGAILPFYNLCSVLRLRMFGELTVKSITFTPNDASTKASGNATVNAADKMLTMSSDAEATVKLNCANGVKLTGTNTDFLMVVPAQKYTGGFTITISTDQGEVVKAVKSDVTLSRSVLYPVKTFECKIDHSKDNIVFEDANFKAYMVSRHDYDNDGEISYEEALYVTKIEVNTDNISSIAGIEYMPNLQHLTCRGSLKYNNSTKVYDIVCGVLKSLDISKNTKLSYLDASYNKLTSLDVRNNIELTTLNCTSNNLSSLDVSNNQKLQDFSCGGNNLSTLDVKNNLELTSLGCALNKLNLLDLKNNKELNWISCNGNNLSYLDFSNNPKLRILYCDNNNLSSLDFRSNPELYWLCCGGNDLTSLNLKNNPKLLYVVCNFNNISLLDVSNCPKLQRLLCNYNNLTSLDVSNIMDLQELYCFSNNISSLDVSNNTALKLLHATDNPLATLYIYEGQTDGITDLKIPSTTNIVVKGSEEPEEWASKEFWHKSLGLKFTATWCGFCPRMATSFSLAQKQLPDKIEVMNVHGYNSNYYYSGISPIISHFKVSGYPTGIIDYRKEISNTSSEDGCADVVSFVKETERNYPTTTGISFNSTVSGDVLNLDIKLYIKEKGEYKLTAVLLENNVIGYQASGGSNYVHDHITRLAISSITGDSFSTSADNKTVSKQYTATIPSGCVKENLTVLVYVLKPYGSQTIIRDANYGDYYVDNATSAPIGTTKDLIFIDGTAYGGNEDTKDGGEITLK